MATQPIFPRLIGVSIPINSQDAGCSALNNWSSSPINCNHGVGKIVSSVPLTEFTLHDHRYETDYIPDHTRAVVMYNFSAPVVIDRILVEQHTNGITRVEGFAGDSIDALTSVGIAWGSRADIIGGNRLVEHALDLFESFPHPRLGRYFQVVIRKTSLNTGYAVYKIIPLTTYI